VAIHLNDKQSMMWGGSTDPCALCQVRWGSDFPRPFTVLILCIFCFQVSSLGAINQKNNSALSGQIAAAFAEAPFGIQGNRIYVEFRDVSAANMGYNGATFAG
jgi:hypothetical protein